MSKIDLKPRIDDALAQVRAAAAYNNTLGQAMKAVEKAEKPIPSASQAALCASMAKGIFDEVTKLQDDLEKAGVDPGTMCTRLITMGDMQVQNAKDYLQTAAEAAG